MAWKEFIKLSKQNHLSAVEFARLRAPFWEFVGRQIPASTIIHELQHALFKNSHKDGDAHGNHTFSLENETYTAMPFEKSCEIVYDAIASRGLWLNISKIVALL
jgi:hypothetical protein